MIEIQALHFIWGMMLMYWFGIWTAYDSQKRVATTALKFLGTLLVLTGMLLIGIRIGQR